MSDPVSALISGGFDLAGGLFASHSASKSAAKDRAEAARQFDTQMNESVQRRVADALKAGINPLTALGYNGGASPTIHAGGGDSSGEIMGNAISRAGRHLSELFDKKAKDDIKMDTESKRLDIEGQRIENRIRLQQLKQLRQSSSGGEAEEKPSMMGEQLLFKPVYDLHGRPRLVINQDAIEADSDNPGYMSSIINAMANAMHNNQITPDGRVTSPQLQMMLDDFYYETTGHHILNLSELYISPTEAAMAASMLARGVS